jgi:hypothetical protein
VQTPNMEDYVRSITLVSFLALAGPLAAQCPHHDHGAMPAAADHDSAFARMQSRGQQVMGVDQYTSRHRFESLPDGGRIELQRTVADSAGADRIRRHLAEEAAAFRRGDFADPAAVHQTEVPGTRVMAVRRDAIRYEVSDLPLGAQIRIVSTDREAIAAVHAFLAFQRQEHRTEPCGMPGGS